ncbi:MAG TPA: hypothetical protein VIL72_13790 [Beijerinckiaceae bacterium]
MSPILLLPLLMLLTAAPAAAQLQLPGAVSGGGAASGVKAGEAKPTGVAVRAPTDATVVGRELRLNGARGRLVFDRRGTDLVVSRLTLSGEKISRVGEACSVDVQEGPFPATPAGRRDGLRRYEVSLPACAFSFELLDGAILARVGDASASSPLGGYCEFRQADCKGFLAGFWGPASSTLGANEIKAIEKTRRAAESNARANYRALLAAAGRDRDKVRIIASEQAGFSSTRSERCYEYQGEENHGFCSSRVTEAWAVALRARLNPAGFTAEDEPAAPARKPRRAVAAPPATPPATAQ